MTGADVIAVRPDEGFDEDRLLNWLREQGLPGTEGPMHVQQFGGGKANLTYLLRFDQHEYVMRRPPLGQLPRGAHDMAREHRALSRLHRSFPQAPEAYLFCDDHSVLGADFFIMAYRQGVVVRERIPDAFVGIEDAPQRMSHALVDTLAALHSVDVEQVGLTDLGRPEGFIERQIGGWYKRWQAAALAPSREMDAVHQWLQQHMPPPQRVSLVHNDYKLDNVMLASDDPGHVVAVFDWDMCTVGDPLSDLGALLTYWIQHDDVGAFQAMAMMPVDARFPTRAELVERYAQASGLDVSAAGFYHVLGLFRLVVILQQIFIRFHRGQTKDQRFARYGDLAQLIAQRAWALTAETD